MSDHSLTPGLRLARLSLSQFRNYPALVWRPQGCIAVITGANGTGKTNLLEAISLLVPGRGLRGARIAELTRRGSSSWAVAGRFDTEAGPMAVGTGTSPDGSAERRVFRLDGSAPRSQAELGSRVSAVWLTPQMDRLFQEGASGRRRFLDRLVYALEPGHAREVSGHDTAMASRNRLLSEGRADAAWLAGVEDAMARHGVAAAAARLALVGQLNAVAPDGAFPPPRLEVLCPVGARLRTGPALAVEDWLRDTLAANRGADAASGSAAVGAHRADLAMQDVATGLAAAQSSTGQQKSLLIGVVLAHAALLAAVRGFSPMLLLDEPLVHLDAQRRAALFAALRALPAQAFLTGTDNDVFAPLRDAAEMVRIEMDALHPDPG